MIEIPDRIQGTDGIRGRICEDEQRGELNPVEFFLKDGFLTPSFFECYTYSYVELLIESKSVTVGDTIIVGWDPRDSKGTFNQSAMNGIRKAGLNVFSVGILPTPAIPLYMVERNAGGSVMLTASHNPSDQNGIKLFHGLTGLKFLPDDDGRLTRQLIQNMDLDLQSFELKGNLENHEIKAKELFIKFNLDPLNSWIDDHSFENTILVIDVSKGAVASVAEEIFTRLPFQETMITNITGNINESCGVADLEGRERIDKSEVIPAGGRFHLYETLQEMFKKSQENQSIQRGETKLTALVFDGDGDRCYALDYNYIEDCLLVSSGDFLGVHQANYLKKSQGAENCWFINTVESDLNTSVTTKQMGYDSLVTGVGDKWILLKAVMDNIRSNLEQQSPLARPFLEKLNQLEKADEISGIELSKLWKECLNSIKSLDSKTKFKFSIGIEESGHCITPGFIETQYGLMRYFAGSGVKSGLNSLVSLNEIFKNIPIEKQLDYLCQPFPPGIKQTFYVYYVNKSKIQPGSEFRKTLEKYFISTVEGFLPEGFCCEVVRFSEEKEMLYGKITKNSELMGAVFIRNSGTEDKSALYLRGSKEIETFLCRMGDQLHLFLLKGLKNKESEFSKFETELLNNIHQNQSIEHLFKNFSSLPVERVLKEIELKEGLIERFDGKLRLTEKGKLLIE